MTSAQHFIVHVSIRDVEKSNGPGGKTNRDVEESLNITVRADTYQDGIRRAIKMLASELPTPDAPMPHDEPLSWVAVDGPLPTADQVHDISAKEASELASELNPPYRPRRFSIQCNGTGKREWVTLRDIKELIRHAEDDMGATEDWYVTVDAALEIRSPVHIRRVVLEP